MITTTVKLEISSDDAVTLLLDGVGCAVERLSAEAIFNHRDNVIAHLNTASKKEINTIVRDELEHSGIGEREHWYDIFSNRELEPLTEAAAAAIKRVWPNA